ncbi:major tail protein [Staphylococcus aureus]
MFKGNFTRSSIKGQTKQDKVEFQNDDVEGNFIDRLFDESSHRSLAMIKKEALQGAIMYSWKHLVKTYDEFMSSRRRTKYGTCRKRNEKNRKS